MAYAVGELMEWLAQNREEFNFGRLYVDATVGRSAPLAGESRAMSYIRKTPAVDLGWLRDVLRHLRLRCEKGSTQRNVADAWTTAIGESTLAKLLPLLDRNRNF